VVPDLASGASGASGAPAAFAQAVTSLRETPLRPELQVEEIPAPQRLAPYSFALAAHVVRAPGSGGDSGGGPAPSDDGDEGDLASGRLVLLYDPDGQEAWEGTLRIVTFVTAGLDSEMAGDPLLAGVGWSWLMDALEAHGARHTAAGGTVTQTSSTRFGDIAGPTETADVELRASWTPLEEDLTPHLLAWCELLCSTAGLPPPGVTLLSGQQGRPPADPAVR
jgi:hypothetical protein